MHGSMNVKLNVSLRSFNESNCCSVVGRRCSNFYLAEYLDANGVPSVTK